MNEQKIVHRALNLENILIKYKDEKMKEYIVKLKLTEDSILLEELDKNKEFNKEKYNLKYIAPEILNGDKYDEKCDLWSLGIGIYALAHKKYPFEGKDESEMKKNIKEKTLKIDISDQKLYNLVRGLLKKKPNERLNWERYLNHPFFNE